MISLNLSADLCAQKQNIKFEHITTEQGLSSNVVNCILQDSKGFIWFGTAAGLNKYDGYKLIEYKNDPLDSTSLSNNWILIIYEDRGGILWIGTKGGGLNKFDRESETFERYQNEEGNPNSLSHNRVISIYEDPDEIASALWIGTEGGGLSRMNRDDREKVTFTHYKHEQGNPNSLSDNWVTRIYEDRTGILWIGTEGGGLSRMNRNDREKITFTHYKHIKGNMNSLSCNTISSICEDRTGVLWIGTYGGGLNKFDKTKEIFTHYRNKKENPSSLSCDYILAIYEDRSGVLWIGTEHGGLNKFERENGIFTSYKKETDSKSCLSNNCVQVIYEDRSNVLWIGTEKGGINKFKQRKNIFKHLANEPGNPNSLSNNHVWAIYEDPDEIGSVLWVGTSGGLNRFDRKIGTFKHYKKDENNPNSLSSNHVMTIHEDHSGLLWIGTYNNGLNSFDRKRETFTHYKDEERNPNSLIHYRVRTIYEDRQGVLWIGTGRGLDKFDLRLNQKIFTHYRHNKKDPNSLSHGSIRAIYEDRKGVLWIGTDGGLNKFDRENETFTHYRHEEGNFNSLSYDQVRSIYEDRTGTLWIGTRGGLNKFNRETEQFAHYTEKDGLPSNVIYGILEDDHGNLWLSTPKGLSKFNQKNETFRNYDISDGLLNKEFELGAYFRCKSGEMFFGGVDGIDVFHPDHLQDNPNIPPIVITEFRKLGKIVKRNFSENEEIVLSYKDDFFSFEFAALDYVNPMKNHYAYKMEGFDSDWIDCGTRRYASYTNLDPGEYRFAVKGSNNDGVWNEEGISMKVTIIPPFWKTWWFRVAGFMIISSLILAIYQIRTYSIKERNKKLGEINVKLNQQIIERKRVERLLQGLNKATLAMEKAPTQEEIFNAVAQEFKELGLTCMIFPLDKSRSHLVPKYLSYDSRVLKAAEKLVGIQHENFSIPYESVDVFREIISKRTTIFEKNMEKVLQHLLPDNVKKFARQIVTMLKISKSISTPLIIENRVIGVFSVQSNDLIENDIPVITAFARQVAATWHKTSLMQNLERSLNERRRAEEQIKTSLKEKEMLLKEIHHRIKNNLQIVYSLLNIQSRNIKNKKILEMFKESQNRIRSMALIHEKLYQSQDLERIDFAGYIVNLAQDLYRSYVSHPKKIDLKVNVSDVSLSIDLAIPCGLIINELITNSLKHAFPPSWQGSGKIKIFLGPTDNNEIELIVKDNGIGLSKDMDIRQTDSLGLHLVTILVEDQLQGKIMLVRRRGTMFKIRFREEK